MLTLRILVSLLLTLNIFHILYDVKNAEIRAIYRKKYRKESKFNRLQIEVFFFSNIALPRIYAQGVLTGFYGIVKALRRIVIFIFLLIIFKSLIVGYSILIENKLKHGN